MAAYRRIADLPLDDRRLRAGRRASARSTRSSSASRPRSTCRARGEEGLGEDVTYDPEQQRAQQEARPGAAARGRRGRSTRSREHLDGLDLFAGERAEDARLPRLPPLGGRVGRARPRAAPGRAVARATALGRDAGADHASSSRCGSASRRASSRSTRRARRLPVAAASSSTPRRRGTTALVDRAGRRPARSRRSTSRAPTRARPVDSPTDPELYRRCAEAFPDAWLEDPDLTVPEADAALEPLPRPDHLGRADPRRRRHRGARVPAARRSTSSRRGSGPGAELLRTLRVVRRARDRHLRRRAVRAGRRARADPVPRVALPPRRAERHRARPATTGPSFPETGLPPSPLAPDLEPTGLPPALVDSSQPCAKPRQIKMEQQVGARRDAAARVALGRGARGRDALPGRRPGDPRRARRRADGRQARARALPRRDRRRAPAGAPAAAAHGRGLAGARRAPPGRPQGGGREARPDAADRTASCSPCASWASSPRRRARPVAAARGILLHPARRRRAARARLGDRPARRAAVRRDRHGRLDLLGLPARLRRARRAHLRRAAQAEAARGRKQAEARAEAATGGRRR